MANKSKINKELGKKVKDLAGKNHNATYIGKAIGVSKDTIAKYCKDNNILLVKRVNPKSVEQTNIFIEELKKTNSPKLAAKKAGIKSNGSYIIQKYNLQDYVKSRGVDNRLSLEEAQSRLPDQTNKVLEFKNGKYIILTLDGYKYEKISSKLYQGDPRNKCGTKLTLEYVIHFLDKLGYDLMPDTYTIKRKPLSAVCRKCKNTRTNRLKNFKKQDCPSCSNTGVSKTEAEINQWVQSFGLQTEKYRFKGKTKGKEIDIYIPSLNLGIEYCGLYWHNESQGKGRNYHYNKMKICEENGIRLITIFEDEWLNRQKQVKNFLKSVFSIFDQKIFARKCKINIVDKKIAKEFLDNNHIQGATTFEVALGLYHENELIGLITGNKHHRQGFESGLVLNRLVFKDGVQIVGGASKLLKYLIKYAREVGYKKLISWSDNRWSQGNVYDKCNFVLVQNLKPDYSYVANAFTRLSKQSCKKSNLLAKGAKGSMDNSERELALTLSYFRIWDCGKKRWEIAL